TCKAAACRVPSGRVLKTLSPSAINGRFGTCPFMSPEIEFCTIVGVPLTTTDGTPLSTVESRSERTVGSRDETVCNHDPSMNRIEPGPKSDNPDTPDKIVREEV